MNIRYQRQSLPRSPIINDKRTPGDAQLVINAERAIAAYKLALIKTANPNRKEEMLAAVDATQVCEPWTTLRYVPEKWRVRQHPLIARKLAKLKHEIRVDTAHKGIEAFDTARLTKLERYTTTVHLGRWINHAPQKRLQQALDAGKCSEKELYMAICSFGGMATRAGDLYAFPVGKIVGRVLLAFMAGAIAVQLFCIAAFVTELLAETCRTCVLVGAIIMFILSTHVTHVLHEVGCRRARGANTLIASGIPRYGECSSSGPWGFLKFIYLGASSPVEGALK